jgi:putative MATE family efflux protein
VPLQLPSNKDIWNLTFPILLSMVAENIINITDTVFLARVGEGELGASAIGGTFYVILFIIGLGFSIGTQIIISRRLGEDKPREVGSVFEISVFFLLVVALLLFILVQLFFAPVFNHMMSSADVLGKTVIYVKYRVWGIFFTFIGCAFRAFYTGIFKTKFLLINSIILAVVNIFFAWVLIFGNLGFSKLGIEGAAIATVIAEMVSVLFYVFATLKFIDLKKYNLFQRKKYNLKIVFTIIDVSGFIILQNIISLVSWFMFFMVIEHRGEHQLAISNIVRSVYIFFMIPGWAFSSATSTMVSNIIGQQNIEGVIPLIKRITKLGFLITGSLMLPAILFPRQSLSLYTSNQQMISDCIPSYYVVMLALFVFSLTFNLFSGVTGTGNTRISLLIEVAGVVLYLATVYFVMILLKLPLAMAWTAEVEYFIVIFIFSYFYIKRGSWKKKVI